MKDYTKRNASYRGMPCWFNPINDELKGKNKLYEFLLKRQSLQMIDNIFKNPFKI